MLDKKNDFVSWVVFIVLFAASYVAIQHMVGP